MKRYNIVTIFPEMFNACFSQGVISKGKDKGLIEINAVNLRDFTTDKHRTTDDYQYGGGVGLVMKPEPIYNAVKSLEKDLKPYVVLMDPRGKKFDQSDAMRLSKLDAITFICGRYEGVDERVKELLVDESFSIGDYILTGGEFPAIVMIDAVARLVDGVLGDETSIVDETFSKPRLEYPHYTRPDEFMDLKVPEVLLNGNHKDIDAWRDAEAYEATNRYRPDLLTVLDQNKEARRVVAKNSFVGSSRKLRFNVALMHYPMRDKQGDTVATAITNLDLHDISRSSCTFGAKRFFVITPLKAQQEIAETVIEHWITGYGLEYNPNRSEAFAKTKVISSLLEALDEIEKQEGMRPLVIITTAKSELADISLKELAEVAVDREILIIFGTGWGFTDELFEFADYVLEPIVGAGDFNHLSVRSAVAIILSRLGISEK